MSIQEPQRLLDGFTGFTAGTDASRSPEAIGRAFDAHGGKVVSRAGWPQTRPSFTRHSFSAGVEWDRFTAGYFEGSKTYNDPSSGVYFRREGDKEVPIGPLMT